MGRITNTIGMGMAIYNEYQRMKLAPPRLVPSQVISLPPARQQQQQQQQAASFSSKAAQLKIVDTQLKTLRAAKSFRR